MPGIIARRRGACSDAPGAPPLSLAALSSSAHARSARHRAGAPPPGDRAALRPARRPARAPPAGQGLAPRPRAARAPVRARAPSEGDQRRGRPAHLAGRGLARRARVAQRGQGLAPRPRARRAPRRAAAPTRPSSAPASTAADQAKHDPFGSRMPDHSVVHRYARCLSYPEWGVGSVTGIYFTGDGDDVQQWARVKFSPGVRTVPAGSLQFVDFSKPDPGRRARAALHDRRPARDGRGRLPAGRQAPDLRARRRADQRRRPAPDDARLLAGRRAHRRGPRRARLGARRGRAPRAASLRRAHLRGHGRDRPRRRGGRPRRGARPGGRRRLGARRAPAPAPHGPRGGHHARSSTPRRLGPSVEGLLDLALAHHLAGDLGAEVTATEQATLLEPASAPAWARYAHALARTDRISDAIAAAERALELNRDDGEVADLLERLRAALPRVLPAA